MAANCAFRRFCSVSIRVLSLVICLVKSVSRSSSDFIRPVIAPLVPVWLPT